MRKCLDLLSDSLNTFFKEMYGDQFGEFVSGYWDLKGQQESMYGWRQKRGAVAEWWQLAEVQL